MPPAAIPADRATSYTAFHGSDRIATGGLDLVVAQTKALIDGGQSAIVLIFDDSTSKVIDIDFRGTQDEVLARIQAKNRAPADAPAFAEAESGIDVRRGPGRPRLGVVAREVTLLPRHWEWLSTQPGGASVALRRLVEDARRTHAGKDRVREAQEAAYRFMSAMAGDRPGFEEATRALFAGRREAFEDLIGPWPPDIRDHTRKLAVAAF